MRLKYESVPHFEKGSVACRDFDLEAFDCPYHIHEELEILRIDSSTGRVLSGDYMGTFDKGQVYVFGSKLPHAFINLSGTVRARSRCIQLSPGPFLDICRLLPETRALGAQLLLANRGLLVRKEFASEASAGMDAVFDSEGLERLLQTLRLLQFLTRESRSIPLASPGYTGIEAGSQVARLEAVLSHIHQHYSRSISISQMAQLAGMSKATFHRFFRQSLGHTPGAYTLDLRLATVARRLLETRDSIAQIAFAEGFNNLSNFNRLFKRRFGYSPRTYRQRIN